MRVELKGRKITYLFNDRVIGFETDKIKLIKSLDMDNNHLYFDSLETDKMIIK